MNSLAEKEGLRGQIQMIYLDPPYGIKFGSNWQPSTRTREVKEGKAEGVSQEPEQVKAFRDTWKDGINSYLSYLRDRLTVAHGLLSETGSIFVQIGDENVHLVRAVMAEIFGSENFCAQITFKKTGAATDDLLASGNDHLVWYAVDRSRVKYYRLYKLRQLGDEGTEEYFQLEDDLGDIRNATPEELAGIKPLGSKMKPFRPTTMTSSHHYTRGESAYVYQSRVFMPGARYWSTHPESISRCEKVGRLIARRQELAYKEPL